MTEWISFSAFLLSFIIQVDFFLYKREVKQLFIAWGLTAVAWSIHLFGG